MTVGRIPVIEGGIQPTIFDAKADLLTATANDTPARLPVGANNTKLVADSTQSTGLKYVGFQGCSVYASSTFVIANNTWTSFTWDNEFFDTDNFHSTSTNTERLTIPTGMSGKYAVTFNALIDPSATGIRQMRVLGNGAPCYQTGELTGIASRYLAQNGSFVISLVAGDYLELQAQQTSGGNLGFYVRAGEIPFTLTYLGA
jgi:hypothetical protein